VEATGKVKTIEQYANEIKALYPQLQKYPASETLQRSIKQKVGAWEKLLDITIFQAQQERKEEHLGWSEENLGYPVKPMILKRVGNNKQVGDYQARYQGGGVAGWVGVLVERKGGKKGMEDLYGTLINADNCARFYREIETFQADERFSLMVVIAECTLTDFLLYVPAFNGNKRNYDHIGASVESRRAKINSLYIRGVPVLFAGTRPLAIEMYRGLIRQWILQHYVSILKLGMQIEDIERAGSLLGV